MLNLDVLSTERGMVAAQFPCHSQVCYDDDMDVEDPTCMAYDMSEARLDETSREEEQRKSRCSAGSNRLLRAGVCPLCGSVQRPFRATLLQGLVRAHKNS